uniref:MULE transposase domain-containing protein n=1 Tax=Lactuca sativa TaxID=4236 RepID=A0A9R1XF35_LACSA|nr:hypothetical protein LSAT_V11C400179900 [Lactuca sativa]
MHLDFLGIDGAFTKGPYPGQIISDVGIDGYSGTYPLAYDVVETKSTHSWTWFLTYLGDDLGLGTNSNFTFTTDKQKLFPYVENRYCLHHIHDNMKRSWRAKQFKVQELRKLNNDVFAWLKKIPPQHWSHSQLMGRC